MLLDPGFGQHLEGFLIKGNLSLVNAEQPVYQGNGSIEASGNLYIDYIEEFTTNAGININYTQFYKDKIYIPFTEPSTSNTGSLISEGGISIKNSVNATSLTEGGSLTLAGGASISKDVYIGGILNKNLQKIIQLGDPDPNEGKDAVNVDFLKDYVDIAITNLSAGSGQVNGNFTTGQIIIADDNNNIRGYDTFTYNTSTGAITIGQGTQLIIANTTNATGLGSGGSLTIYGGASISQAVYIGGGLDVNDYRITNVGWPIDGQDAVNVDYLQNEIADAINGLGSQIPGNFSQGQIIIGTAYNSVKGTDFFTFLQTSETSANINLNGATDLNLYNTENATGLGTGGALTVYGGASFQKDVYIGGTLSVTANRITDVAMPIAPFDAVNKAYVDSKLAKCCCADPNGYEYFFTLNNNVLTPENITEFTYDYTIAGFVAYIYVDVYNGKRTLYTIRGLNHPDGWISNISFIGDIIDDYIEFYCATDIDGNCLVQYTNKYTTGETTIRFRTTTQIGTIDDPCACNAGEEQSLTLLKDTSIPANVHASMFNYSITSSTNFQETFYIQLENDTKRALYYISGLYAEGGWEINVKYIGDDIGIDFYITNVGILQYTNSNILNDAVLRYYNDPFVGHPLPVNKGGTGKSEILPYAILRGNAKDTLIATNELLFKNGELLLSSGSSIVLYDTSAAINLTSGGTLTSYGGVSIKKNLIVGTELNVNDINMTPNVGDIFTEVKFTTGNNKMSPENIPGFILSDPLIKSFVGTVCVTIELNNNQFDCLYEIKALKKVDGWIIRQTFIGDDIEMIFYISNSGQIQYTCPDYGPNWTSTVLKAHGKTTTYP